MLVCVCVLVYVLCLCVCECVLSFTLFKEIGTARTAIGIMTHTHTHSLTHSTSEMISTSEKKFFFSYYFVMFEH